MRVVLEVVAQTVEEIMVPRAVADVLRRTPIGAKRKTTAGARAGIESSARAPSCNALSNINCPLTKHIELCRRG